MDIINQSLDLSGKIIESADNMLSSLLTNPYISFALQVMVIFYAALVAPTLPPFMVDLFDNTIARIVVAFLILFLSTKNAALSLVLAAAFIMVITTTNKLRLYAVDLSKSPEGEISWLPQVKKAAKYSLNNVKHITNDTTGKIKGEIVKFAKEIADSTAVAAPKQETELLAGIQNGDELRIDYKEKFTNYGTTFEAHTPPVTRPNVELDELNQPLGGPVPSMVGGIAANSIRQNRMTTVSSIPGTGAQGLGEGYDPRSEYAQGYGNFGSGAILN